MPDDATPDTDPGADDVRVVDVPDANRFEVRVAGELAGLAQYVRRSGRVVFTHTEVDPRFEGRGLGSTLAAGALEAVRGEGGLVVPLCPFIARYIERHPDYDELVDHEVLAGFDTPA